ncbi:hypothetical protein G6F57_005354 [Rhizopus arrhizus]|uniref:RGS domain-containing protein n=1 Tax=Rhizopus oryzae TaxID=64495 RepID=A0A9P6X9T0_RHIOR|nr:hypothetical protein G6F23_005932 [Rhizopus arrhizus]KAG1421133.1 hypothetical protein G6F58_003877 [Rhizopus delemar]KAG0761518.1 hypothetical protein G6F24_007501 [Rhizopus arrhizus]KAG0787798.1 hypothetical protein G6F21_007660 [Rhizopus arrhizus]KAG0798998.1 hypothetical protein G6F22_003667 [Rhizopus arrhizus]
MAELYTANSNSYFPSNDNEESKPRYRHRSSSVSSLLSLNLIPSFDGHTLYKLKTARSTKKIERFFGEDAPHDICIKEIKKEGLKAILQSKYPLCYFLYHLLDEYSSENLFFFIELEQYESFKYTSAGQQIATAQHIYNTYIAKNSYFEVNLDDKVCREVTLALEQKDVKCFDTAKRAVYSLLESSYIRFRTSDTFDLMAKECGELTTEYKKETKLAAINRLFNYIEQQNQKAHLSSTQKQYELMRSMIYEFCNTYIGVTI